MSDYEKYKNKYISTIVDYSKNNDLHEAHYIYELLWAIELNLISWEDIPPGFEDTYDLPHKRDYGIDLISLQFDKTCQVKMYGEKSLITWSDISKYNTYSSDILNIKHMTIATTTVSKIDSMVVRLFKNDNKHIIRKDFDTMIREVVNDYKPVVETRRIVSKIEERSYLLDCFNLITTTPKKSINLQLPCGCGKTYIMLYTIIDTLKVNKDSKFIIFCPWIDLGKQTKQLFDDFNISNSFIGDGHHTIDNKSNVIICINQSVEYIPLDMVFKYKFIDEAHHLEDEESKIKKKLHKLKCETEISVSATFHDQDNLDYHYPMREAIDAGYISDYILHIQYFSDGDKLEPLSKMIQDNIRWGPMLIYFNNTERCIQFNELLQKLNIESDYITGKTNSNKRQLIKNKVKDNCLQVVCLCGCWNEGESIDNIQTVIFGDLRHSQINKIQIAMRANRLHKDKPFYRVIIPLQDSDFQNTDIKDVINTFAEIDSTLKKAIENKSNTRLQITDRRKKDKVDLETSELLCEEIYNRLGELIQSSFDKRHAIFIEYCNEFGIPMNMILN